MQKIEKLFDDKYVLNFFNKRILVLYPDFKKIKKIEIISHKNFIWSGSYHVVIEYKVFFVINSEKNKKNKIEKLCFFCTAHSSEPRKNVYEVLKYLWDKGFSRGFLTIPKPILYSKHFNASFYRGVRGDSLLVFIKDKNRRSIEKIVKKTAEWLAKFHKIAVPSDIKLNKCNSKIKTVVPGYHKILKIVGDKYDGKYVKDIKKIYDYLIELEEDFFKLSHKRWLVHGDVHPENIIKISKDKMALIDFADICSSDFTRDLGTFLQQVEYKLLKKGYSRIYVKKIHDIFIENYCKKAKIKYNARIKERVKLYYYWTAIRTAVYCLTKHKPQEEAAVSLILELKKKIKI